MKRQQDGAHEIRCAGRGDGICERDRRELCIARLFMPALREVLRIWRQSFEVGEQCYDTDREQQLEYDGAWTLKTAADHARQSR